MLALSLELATSITGSSHWNSRKKAAALRLRMQGFNKIYKEQPEAAWLLLVPGGGLEPPHLAAADFESAASTDSAIPAWKRGA